MLHHCATPRRTRNKNTNQRQETKYKSDLKSVWIKYQARWPLTAVVAQPQYWTSSGSSPSGQHLVVYIYCLQDPSNNTLQHQQSSKKVLIPTLLYRYHTVLLLLQLLSNTVQWNVNPHEEKPRPSIILYIFLYHGKQSVSVSHCDFVASPVLCSALVKHLLLPGNFKGVQLVLPSCEGIVDHSLGCAWRTGEHSICI